MFDTNHPDDVKLARALAALCAYTENLYTNLAPDTKLEPQILVARTTDPYIFPLPQYPGDIPNFTHIVNNYLLPGIANDPTARVTAIALIAQGNIPADPTDPNTAKTPAILLTQFTPEYTVYLVWNIDPTTNKLHDFPLIANFAPGATPPFTNPLTVPPISRTLN